MADLPRYYPGVKLRHFFEGKMTAREALVYVDHLPSDSAFAEASAQDDELAEMLLRVDEDSPKPTPRVTEFGPTNRMLADICDRLGEFIQVVVAARGVEPPKIQPVARPVTALERAALRVEDSAYDDLLGLIEAAREQSS